MPSTDLKLLQGTLDVLILKALAGEARHGYSVAKWVRETTDEALQVEEGALYAALHRMEERGWIKARWGLSENNRRAKFYTLTGAGRKQLEEGSRALSEYAEAVFKVLRADAASTA